MVWPLFWVLLLPLLLVPPNHPTATTPKLLYSELMLKVGLTGSIAVGKTFVVECFRELGCHVLDADLTARKVVQPGTEGLRHIVEEFGEGVLVNGSLDRKKLGKIVFADPEKRNLLNSIVHPLVIEKQNEWIEEREAEDPDGVAIIDPSLVVPAIGAPGWYRVLTTVFWGDASDNPYWVFRTTGYQQFVPNVVSEMRCAHPRCSAAAGWVYLAG